MAPYGDMHRLFLQGCISRNCMPESVAKELFQAAAKLCEEEEEEGQELVFHDFIDEINHQLNVLDLELRAYHAQRDGTLWWGLVNMKEDEVMKTGTDYSPQTIVFFRTLIAHIMSAPNFAYAVSSTAALSLARSLKQAMSTTEAEALLEDLVQRQWLEYRGKYGCYILGPRTLLELKFSFAQGYPDERRECFICQSMVTEGLRCSKVFMRTKESVVQEGMEKEMAPPDAEGEERGEGSEEEEEAVPCEGFMHTYCAKTYLARHDRCKVCSNLFEGLPVGMEVLAHQRPQNSSIPSRDKRPPSTRLSTTQVSSDSDD